MKKHWTDKLIELDACAPAIEWAKRYRSLDVAWRRCERGDWMLWLVGRLCKTAKARKRLVLAACTCAEPALRYVSVDENRPKVAIQTARRWVRGRATLAEVRAAAVAAYAATAVAAYAATAAADVAAYAATAATYAATAATYAAIATGGHKTHSLKESAKIVRKYYPRPPKI